MFAWIKNRAMQGTSQQCEDRLLESNGYGPVTHALALAIGHACYPSGCPEGFFGHGSFNEDVMKALRSLPPPCESSLACHYCESWLTRREISTDQAFMAIWGVGLNEMARRIVERVAANAGKSER